MRKFMNKAVMVMLIAFLTLSLSACGGDSEDDDDLSGGKGKMTGWVKIDGKKYDFNYFYGAKNPDDSNEVSFYGGNKDPFKLKRNEYYNQTSISLAFKDDNTLDTEDGHPAIDIDFEMNCKAVEDEDESYAESVMYAMFENLPYDGITVSRNGDKYTIDGKDVEVRRGEKGTGSVGSDDPIVTIDFHFEGTPKWLSEEDIY